MSQGRKTKESPPPSLPPTTSATTSNNNVKKTDAELPSPLRTFNASQRIREEQPRTEQNNTDNQ